VNAEGNYVIGRRPLHLIRQALFAIRDQEDPSQEADGILLHLAFSMELPVLAAYGLSVAADPDESGHRDSVALPRSM